ncbi:MAG: TraB/GumN family protein [Saprospiraceae bacterium]
MTYKPSLLWELSSSNGPKSYLFGSIHISGVGLDQLKKSLTTYIQSCDTCALEINLEELSEFNLSEYQFLEVNDSPLNYIQVKKWNRLAKQLSLNYNFDLEEVKNLKPLLLLNLIIQKFCSETGEVILDEWIWTYAKSQLKRIVGLESIEEHYGVLSKIKLSSQYKMLYQSLSNLPKFKKNCLDSLIIIENKIFEIFISKQNILPVMPSINF